MSMQIVGIFGFCLWENNNIINAIYIFTNKLNQHFGMNYK